MGNTTYEHLDFIYFHHIKELIKEQIKEVILHTATMENMLRLSRKLKFKRCFIAFSLCNNWQVKWNDCGSALVYDLLLIKSIAEEQKRARKEFI